MNHDKVTEVGHSFFVLNSKIDVGATCSVVGKLWGLPAFFGNRGEHVIVIKVAWETPSTSGCTRLWWNARHVRCASWRRDGVRHHRRRGRCRQDINRCRIDGFLFDKRCNRRDIDEVIVVVNLDDLRRRRKMFRNNQICIPSCLVGKVGPINFVRWGWEGWIIGGWSMM